MIKEMTINSITKYIEDNIEAKNIHIDSLVSYSGYSRRYLQKIFKDKLGFSIGKYIQLRRISRAAILLRLSNLSISSISTRLCYDSQQTFTREFKKNTGHTPLQYRKNKIWTFRNMTGYRDTNNLFPLPEIYHIDNKFINGFLFRHKEQIPFTGKPSEERLRRINEKLEKRNTIYISNRICLEKTTNNEVLIDTIIWTDPEHSNTQIELNSGSYACFSFTGSHESYLHFIYHVYMSLLPFFNLPKRDDFDIEIISKDDSSCFIFKYFIPIFENEEVDSSYNTYPLTVFP
ncbi:helix-turn-helix domain-containing protein [Citrobacter sp. S-77]|uniref:helix-turn-helix domain-containing protein n=1 Tax=Citrobacter sp. S-77 TaxID=1080067 RepID=UPI0008FFD5E5|nr:helix-turn-helix domain-containing protein [Citrobacter sp. S-77]